MRQSTLERRIKEDKEQPKFLTLNETGTKIQFTDAPNDNYIPYLRFEDEYGRFLGALNPSCHRKALRQLQRWVNKCLTGDSRG